MDSFLIIIIIMLEITIRKTVETCNNDKHANHIFWIYLQNICLFLATFRTCCCTLNFISLYSHLAPSQGNLVESKNYLNIPENLQEGCVLSEPHFTCSVYCSTLSYRMTCLYSADHGRRMKLKLVLEIYVKGGKYVHSNCRMCSATQVYSHKYTPKFN